VSAQTEGRSPTSLAVDAAADHAVTLPGPAPVPPARNRFARLLVIATHSAPGGRGATYADGMTVVSRTFVVTAAPGTVLDYLMDFGHTNEWDPATQRTTRIGSGPVTVGAAWHNVAKVRGVTTELTYCLAALESDRLVFIGRNEGATSTDTITVRPLGGSSEVTYHVDLEMHGLAKLITPVMKIEFEKLANEVVIRLTGLLNRLPSAASPWSPIE
jgi:carbon monoxide dehydrogenase subunit G